MFSEITVAMVAALAGVLLPVLRKLLESLIARSNGTESKLGRALLEIVGMNRSGDVPSHQKLFSELAKASAEMDRIVGEIEAFTKGRQMTVAKIEGDLQSLSQQESELKKRVEGLQNVPLPAAEFFAKIIEEREKKSALRDYLLFLAGVVVRALVAILLRKFGYG